MSKITKNLVYLVNNLSNLEIVLVHLFQDEVISNDERERILGCISTTDKCSQLFTTLERKDWAAIEEPLLNVLRETCNENLADKIQSTIIANQSGPKSANGKILQCLPYLTSNMTNMSPVLNHFISQELIDFNQRSIIMSKVGDEQVTELFSILLRKNLEENLCIVIDILRETGNGHLANKIIQCS